MLRIWVHEHSFIGRLSRGVFLWALLAGLAERGGMWPACQRAEAAELEQLPGPADNPLKGFMPYAGAYSTFPHSLEWTYLQLRDVQIGYTDFRWSYLDGLLNKIAARGHQAVFRTFLDYPNQRYGVPDFLAHVPKRSYSDYDNGVQATSYSPDYSHPDLRRAMTNYIAALGARYDGDPRIGFITIGMLGFWGEWHTFPYNGFDGKPDWFAPVAVQRELLDAFVHAFPRTKLLVREPKEGLDFRQWPVGYHDDSFAFSTLAPTPWHFWPRLVSAGLDRIWRTQPIGGEVRPEIQSCIWQAGSTCVPEGQGYVASVTATHASWMLNQGAFDAALTGDAKARAIEGARQLGYDLRAQSAVVPARNLASALPISVTLTNSGVAPFYYPWPVRLGLLSAAGQLHAWTNTWDLRTIMPGQKGVEWSAALSVGDLPAGDYTVLMNVPNPLPTGKPLRFGNRQQDATLPGWLTLGAARLGRLPGVGEITRVGESLQVEFTSLNPGWRYALERSASGNLVTPDWRVVEEWTADSSHKGWSHSVVSSQAGEFFRLVELP